MHYEIFIQTLKIFSNIRFYSGFKTNKKERYKNVLKTILKQFLTIDNLHATTTTLFSFGHVGKCKKTLLIETKIKQEKLIM